MLTKSTGFSSGFVSRETFSSFVATFSLFVFTIKYRPFSLYLAYPSFLSGILLIKIISLPIIVSANPAFSLSQLKPYFSLNFPNNSLASSGNLVPFISSLSSLISCCCCFFCTCIGGF